MARVIFLTDFSEAYARGLLTGIARYAKEQLEKAEIRNQLTQQVLTSKLYDAIENAVSLDKQTVSLDDFKKIAQEA